MNQILGIKCGKEITTVKLLLVLPLVFFMISCSGQKKSDPRGALELMLQEDLKAVIKGIPDSVLLEKPHYEVVSYKDNDTGAFATRAIVDFYYMKKIPVKLVTKYRYRLGSRTWDRYNNAYVAIKDSSGTSIQPGNDSAGAPVDSSSGKSKVDSSKDVNATPKDISESKGQTIGALKTPLVISKSAISVRSAGDTSSSKSK